MLIRKVLIVVSLMLLPFLAKAEGLITAANKTFTPPDRVLFKEDFSKCPIGEPPERFNKVSGAGECVKYKNRIWVAPATDGDYRLYKKLNLGNNGFAIEFDFVGYQSSKGASGADFIFRLLKSRTNDWDKDRLNRDLQIHDEYNGYTFWLEVWER